MARLYGKLPAATAVMAITLALTPGAATAAQPRETAYEQLGKMLEKAPARQAGQPGNDVIDKMVQSRFEEAVKKNNDAVRWTEAVKATEAADLAEKKLAEEQNKEQFKATSASGAVSPAIVKYTLESPGVAILMLTLVEMMLVTGWWFQRRRVLLIAVGAVAFVIAGLPITAFLVETKAEKARKAQSVSNTGTGRSLVAVVAAAQQALEADTNAAKSLKGLWQCGRMYHPTAAFVPGKAELKTAAGNVVRLYQMAPNLVEPANLKNERFSGRLVYAGLARSEDLAGKDLTGTVTVVDFDSGHRWVDAVQLGAEVIIVLEPPANLPETFGQAAQKITASPIRVPRFYMKREDVRRAFGDNWEKDLSEGAAVTISQEPAKWQYRVVATDWLFIPGRAEAKGGDVSLQEDTGRQMVHIQTYKDSSSVVPELSPGASSAANVVLLLRLLDKFEKEPPERPVLLSVVNDHANALNGEQEYSFAVFGDPKAILLEAANLDRELALQQYIADIYSQSPTAELIDRLRSQTEDIGGRNFVVKEPAQVRLTHLRNVSREEVNRMQLKLDDDQKRGSSGQARLLTDEETASLKAKMDKNSTEAADYVKLMGLFNRIGSKTYVKDLTPKQKATLDELFAYVAGQAKTQADELIRSRERLMGNLVIRRRLMYLTGAVDDPAAAQQEDMEALFARRYAVLPAATVITLDLAFGTDQAGFFYMGFLPRWGSFSRKAEERISRLARETLLAANEYARQAGVPNRLVDTIRNVGGVPWVGYMGGRLALANTISHQYDVAGITLTSVRDMRPRAFTPFDTVDRIDKSNFTQVMSFAEGYLPMLVNSPGLGNTISSRGKPETLSIEVTVRKKDKFSVGIPKDKIVGAVVMCNIHGSFPANDAPMLAEVRPQLILLSDRRGTTTLRGQFMNKTSVLVFEYDAGFRKATAALDFGQGESQFISTFMLPTSTEYETRNVIAFSADKVDLIGLSEPLTLKPADKIDVIDARQDSMPQHYSVAGVASVTVPKVVPMAFDGTGCVFVEPETPFKLRIGTGLAINTNENAPQGEGFPSNVGALKNLVLTSAKDMWRLTDSRLQMLTLKGVKNETAIAFNDAAKDQMESLQADQTASRTDKILVGAEEARGLSFRAYTRGLQTINDLIKAVVIFLALVIPFCFFLMKLVTPYTDLNRQLVLFGGIFVLMVVVLQLVHPAFEVAKMPQVVILAFIILGLAVFVATILIGRFNASMNQAVEEALLADSMDAPQSRLAGVAFMVGVNNMKRRRIRTTLTSATIVLVTFTMLSVISVGQDVQPVQLKLGGEAPYDGIVYANPGLAPIDSVQLRRIRSHFEAKATTVARMWVEKKDSYGVYLPCEIKPVEQDTGVASRSLNAKVILGLEVAENGFLGPLPILPGGRWFTANDVPEVVLSRNAAQLIGITPDNLAGKEVWMQGIRMRLVGLLDDEALEKMRDVGSVPILPLLVDAGREKQVQSLVSRTQAASSGLIQAGDLTDIPGTHVARAQDVAMVPAGFAQTLGEGAYHTLSIKYDVRPGEDPQAVSQRVWDDANRLIRFQDVRLSVSLKNAAHQGKEQTRLDVGQYAMASSSSAQVGGVLKVAIPIILAATIILNTMLGSVMERKREIGIYNAIGLNPTHVMVFFLAESLVFGLVGSVAGYLIGQILSLIMSKFIDLNLNYSSLSVMVVIFLTIMTVLLSTVYPAMMAARAAVPSGQRRWSLPQPEGDEIHVNFPFVYDENRVLGACAYLHDFMKQNSEASVGKFLAKPGARGRIPPPRGTATGGSAGSAYAMLFDISPAPFDLGVNQKMEVYAYFDEHVHAHMLSVYLTRVSGQKSNWVTVNQPFLEALRKRLLSWRSQKLETQQTYCRQGEALFRNAPWLRVRPATQGT